jgi:flagellar protein FliS
VSTQLARQRYLADRVHTATPAQLIVMLYDRLAVDIQRAITAQLDGDPAAASAPLLHAQQIVTELHSSLDPSAWSGGDDLAALYRYVLFALMHARSTPDPDALQALAKIVSDLGSSWRAAAAELAAAGPRALDGPAAARVG